MKFDVIKCQTWDEYYDRSMQSVLDRMSTASIDGRSIPEAGYTVLPPLPSRSSTPELVVGADKHESFRVAFPAALFELNYKSELCIAMLMCLEQVFLLGTYFTLSLEKLEQTADDSTIAEQTRLLQLSEGISEIVTFFAQQYFELKKHNRARAQSFSQTLRNMYSIKRKAVCGLQAVELRFGRFTQIITQALDNLKQCIDDPIYIQDDTGILPASQTLKLEPQEIYDSLEPLLQILFYQAIENSEFHPALCIPTYEPRPQAEFAEQGYHLTSSSAVLDLFVWYDTSLSKANSTLFLLAAALNGAVQNNVKRLTNDFCNLYKKVKLFMMWRKASDAVMLSEVLTILNAVCRCFTAISASKPDDDSLISAPTWFTAVSSLSVVLKRVVDDCKRLANAEVSIKDPVYLAAATTAKDLFFHNSDVNRIVHAADNVYQKSQNASSRAKDAGLKIIDFKLAS